MDTQPEDEPQVPDPATLKRDPAAFRDAHARYGGYLKEGGLPFEPEEVADDDPESARDREASGEQPVGPADSGASADDGSSDGE